MGEFRSYKKRSTKRCARASRFDTDETCQRPPRGDRIPRWLSALVVASIVVAPEARIAFRNGSSWRTKTYPRLRPEPRGLVLPHLVKFARLPSRAPAARLAAKGSLVRSEISRRSFSASAAYSGA